MRAVKFARKSRAAFTLVEMLAAMAFMAIVIPATVQGLQIANRAGMVGQRKAVAARILDSAMNEWLANSQARSGVTSGIVQEGELQYQWRIQLQNWTVDSAMRVVTGEVTYTVQGQKFTVNASTLIDQNTR
jgi:type II secretory pathway pseudopilin PulG